ncbi:MAG: acyltransferase [Pedobacter sp.]|nr:MAG: acyltransferase [Pedobacter sp.]
MDYLNTKLLKILYKILKQSFLSIDILLSWSLTFIKFKLNGVHFSNDFISRGIPLVNVNLKGCFSIGKGFVINNGINYNMIGRQQQCFFIVGPNAVLNIANNVGLSGVAIICYKKIEIEDNVKIGGNTVIYDSDFHSLNPEERNSQPENLSNVIVKSVKIKKGAFIGAHCTILKGVTVGENSIVGAGSVVSRSIPNGEIWAGNPAKFIKNI